MVNNEFHLIGTAISGFLKAEQQTFTFYIVKVEVEKLGNTQGKKTEAAIQFFENNKYINFNENIYGKTVVINGYIDSYANKKNGILNVQLVGQNLMVLGSLNDVAKNRRDFNPAPSEEPKESNASYEDVLGDLLT